MISRFADVCVSICYDLSDHDHGSYPNHLCNRAEKTSITNKLVA